MNIKIDQSGKVEQKEFDTRISAVRGRVSSVCIITKKLKREFLSMRNIKMHKKEKVQRMFSAGIFLSIKPLFKDNDELNIDREYPGQSGDIKKVLFSILKEYSYRDVKIYFVSHDDVIKAHKVANNPIKADHLIRISNRNKNKIYNLIFNKKK